MILFLGTDTFCRYIESRMSADGKVHGLLAVAGYFPADADLIFVQYMFNL